MDWPLHIRRVIDRLGEDVTYIPQFGAQKTVRGIFVGPYQTIAAAQLGFETAATEFVAMAADFPDPARNDSLDRAGLRYQVRKAEPDLLGGFVRLVVGELPSQP